MQLESNSSVLFAFLWPSKRADITDFSLMEGTLLFQSSLGLTSCEHLQVLTVSQDKGVP